LKNWLLMEIHLSRYNLNRKTQLEKHDFCRNGFNTFGGLVMGKSKKQVNTYLPSLPNTDIFQLVVAGDFTKVKRFWQFIKTSPEYRLSTDFRMLFDNLDQKGNMHIVMQVEETPFIKSHRNREESMVQIQDQKGKNMMFTLSDIQIVEMSGGVVYIRGKNFDIFADPFQDSRNDREVVDCTVVNEEATEDVLDNE
jgi:hypothetical protein